jgi:hypothetical protein
MRGIKAGTCRLFNWLLASWLIFCHCDLDAWVSRDSPRQARFFLLLVQKKEPKEKDTLYHAPAESPALLAKPGGNQNSP